MARLRVLAMCVLLLLLLIVLYTKAPDHRTLDYSNRTNSVAMWIFSVSVPHPTHTVLESKRVYAKEEQQETFGKTYY